MFIDVATVVTDGLNLREAPGGEIVGYLSRDDRLEIHDSVQHHKLWYGVRTRDGRKGYVIADAIKLDPVPPMPTVDPVQPAPPPEPPFIDDVDPAHRGPDAPPPLHPAQEARWFIVAAIIVIIAAAVLWALP